jgi:hypothetical protein
MNAYSGFGSIAGVNDITWYRAGWRPASTAEIAAQRADTNAAQALANITSEASTRAAADSALATRTTTLEASTGNLSSRVTTTEGAISTLQGRTEAYWNVDVQSGTGRAIVALQADGVSGSSSLDLVAGSINLATTADGLTYKTVLATDTSGNVKCTGDIIWTNGSVMKVAGVGFGTSNQFIEWFGPLMALTSCSESNATMYLRTDGAAYFGGALSSGTLTTKAGTSDTSASAIAETAVFGSNGHSITVTLSYSYGSTQTAGYAAGSAGLAQFNAAYSAQGGATKTYGQGAPAVGGGDPSTFTVDLYRSVNGGAYAKVTTLTVSGSWSCGGIAPGNTGDGGGTLSFQDNAGGSLTYTDPQTVAQNRQYKAVLTGRNPHFANTITQNISLVCVEQ